MDLRSNQSNQDGINEFFDAPPGERMIINRSINRTNRSCSSNGVIISKIPVS